MARTNLLFPDMPTIGGLPPREAIPVLKDIGEDALADSALRAIRSRTDPFTADQSLAFLGFGRKKNQRFVDLLGSDVVKDVWRFTEHAFGFIGTQDDWGNDPVAIQAAGTITAQANLRGKRVKVTLDRLRAAEYPGGGIHRILVDFYAQHQVSGSAEQLHFTQTFRVQQGQGAGIAGYPIFVGLGVGTEGVAFKVYTVNVQNDDDQAVLNFLDTDTFNSGLKLLKTINPVIQPLSSMAVGVVKLLASRHKNVPVQDFYMGLDFTSVRTRARLAEGSYVAVQIPDAARWSWADWIYDPQRSVVVLAKDPTQAIPLNYMIFSVSEYTGD